MRPIVRGSEFHQRPSEAVSRFWDSTAEWRVSYFERLASGPSALLSTALSAEREFVLMENSAVAEWLPEQGTCIELGCGVGRSLWTLASSRSKSVFIGLDFALRQLQVFSRESRRRSIPNMFPIAADVGELPLKSCACDAALILNQTFGTLLGKARESVLRELRRVLRVGAPLIIGGFDQIELAAACYKEWGVSVRTTDPTGFFELEHYSSFWQRQDWLEAEVCESGFRVVTSKRGGLGYVLHFARVS